MKPAPVILAAMFLVLTAVILAGCTRPAPPAANTPAPLGAQVERERNEVWWSGDSGATSQQVQAQPKPAAKGDLIWTKLKGIAILKWPDVHIALIGDDALPDSKVDIKDVTPDWLKLQIAGTTVASKLPAGTQRVEVTAGGARVTLTGTTVMIAYDAAHDTAFVRTFQGTAQVQSALGSAQAAPVGKDEWAKLEGNRAPVVSADLDAMRGLARDYGLWNEFHDAELEVYKQFGLDPVQQEAVELVFIDCYAANGDTQLWREPSNSAEVVAILPQGTVSRPLSRSGKWVQVRVDNTKQEGWLDPLTQAVTCQPSTVLVPTTPVPAQQVTTEAAPNSTSTPTLETTRTAPPRYTDTPTTEPSVTLTITSEPTNTPTLTPTSTRTPDMRPVCSAVADRTNLREGPNQIFPIVRTVGTRDRLIPIGRDAKVEAWLQVRLEGTQTQGWVAKNLVKCSNVNTGSLPVVPVQAPQVGLKCVPEVRAIRPGECVQLEWAANNATSVTLDGKAVGLAGTSQQCLKESQTFGLLATGPGGNVKCVMQITVAPPPNRIDLPDQPNVIVQDPFNNRLFVTLKNLGAVGVVDEETQQIVAQIPVGTQPFGAAIDGSTLYVANFASASVSVIDTNALKEIARVDLSKYGSQPTYVTTYHGKAYIALHGGGKLIEMQSGSWRVSGSAYVGQGLFGLAAAGSAPATLVSDRDERKLAWVPLNQSELSIGRKWYVDGSPFFVAYSGSELTSGGQYGGFAYVTQSPASGPYDQPTRLTVFRSGYDQMELLRDVNIGAGGTGGGYIAIAGTSVWLSANSMVRVYNQDLSAAGRTFSAKDGLGKEPFAIAFAPKLNRVYVGNQEGFLTVLPYGAVLKVKPVP